MNTSSHCRTRIFIEEFKFQYVSEDVHVHIAAQSIILTSFLSTWLFSWQIKYEISRNICKRNTFQTTNLHALQVSFIGSFSDESFTIRYISQLKWNWRAHSRVGFSMVLNDIWHWNFLWNSYFRSKRWLRYSSCLSNTMKFRQRDLHIFQSPTVELKLQMWRKGFIVFLNVNKKITFRN